MNKIGTLLREARKAKGLSQLTVATRFAIKPSAVSQWENDVTRPDRDKLQELAKLYGLDVTMLLGSDDPQSPKGNATVDEPHNVSQPIDVVPSLPQRGDMPRNVEVLGTAVGGSSGDFEMNGDVIDYVRRPPGIAHRKDVFALWVEGESMKPWRKPRELIFLERARQVMIGDHVVVELVGEGADPVKPAYLKLLVRVTARHYRLEQYNPAKQFDVDRRRVANVYRVLEWSELLNI